MLDMSNFLFIYFQLSKIRNIFTKTQIMKRNLIIIASLALFTACGGSEQQQQTNTQSSEVKTYDPSIGEGKFTSITIPDSIDSKLVEEGKQAFENKCVSCHKTNEEKLVGPGLKGITTRKKAEWIMNYVSNPELMIEKDPELQEQVKLYTVRMPNQGITESEARSLYEYLRSEAR